MTGGADYIQPPVIDLAQRNRVLTTCQIEAWLICVCALDLYKEGFASTSHAQIVSKLQVLNRFNRIPLTLQDSPDIVDSGSLDQPTRLWIRKPASGNFYF